MPIPSDRTFPIVPLPVHLGSSDYKITRGMIEKGVMISVLYSANVTVAGTAVRARSIPIRTIQLKADDGTVLQVWRAQDLISIAQILEQTPTGPLLVPASGFAIANYTLLEAHIPLIFEQQAVNNGDRFALPTGAYGPDGLVLTINFGNIADLLVGPAADGLITFTANGATVTQLDYGNLPVRDWRALGAITPRSINRYIEGVQAAVAQDAMTLDLGTGVDIRGVLITQELASNGEPTNTIVLDVTFAENQELNVFSHVPWATLRAINARRYGLTLPTGVAIIDFAEDKDINHIYSATTRNKVQLLLKTAAIAGTVRAAVLGVAGPKPIAA